MCSTDSPNQLIEEGIKSFDKLQLGKFENGLHVPCSREDYHNFLRTFAHSLIKGERETLTRGGVGLGVSQWREYGKKYGYWDFFLKEERERPLIPLKRNPNNHISKGRKGTSLNPRRI